MEKDLHISDQQYLIALTIFFFPYALFEVSSFVSAPLGTDRGIKGSFKCILKTITAFNMAVSLDDALGSNDGMSWPMISPRKLSHKIRPCKALFTTTVVCLVCLAYVSSSSRRAVDHVFYSFRYAVDARHIRGGPLSRSKLLPFMVRFPFGLDLVISPSFILLFQFSWYKRSEFGLRAAVFFSAATISGAFGGLLAVGGSERPIPAYPIHKMCPTSPSSLHRRRYPTWQESAANLDGHGSSFSKD